MQTYVLNSTRVQDVIAFFAKNGSNSSCTIHVFAWPCGGEALTSSLQTLTPCTPDFNLLSARVKFVYCKRRENAGG